MNTGNFFSNLRREYWENKVWLFVLPIILSILLVALSLLLAKYVTALSVSADEFIVFQSEKPESKTLDFSAGAKPLGDVGNDDFDDLNGDEVVDEIKQHLAEGFDTDFDESPLAMLAVYLASAWLVSFFYFAACLYTDRKDNSILFWKSLPVSERETVLAKLAFGVFGFTMVSLVIGWLCWLVIMAVGMLTPMGELILDDTDLGSVLRAIYIAPILVVLGFIRGLPLIGLLMLLSAVAKRSPLMMGVVIAGFTLLAEKLIFSSSLVYQWLTWHLPLVALDTEVAEEGSMLAYQVMDLLSHPFMLISGIIVGVLALAAAVWCREHRFEI